MIEPTLREKSIARKSVIPLLKGILKDIKEDSLDTKRFILKAFKAIKIPAFPDVIKIKDGLVTKVSNFPKTFKVEGKVDVEFPSTQKVEVINQPEPPTISTEKVVFPKKQTIEGEVTNKKLEKKLDLLINVLKEQKEMPDILPVRVTNQVMGGGGGGGVHHGMETMLGLINNTEKRTATLDASTHATTTITYPHHETHAGSHFVCREVDTLSIDNVLDIQMTTPDTTKEPHMIFQFEVESKTEFWVYENVTINTPGAVLGCGNRNRNSSRASTLSLKDITNTSIANANDDTAIAGAVQLAHGILGTGKKSGGSATSREEVILKRNTVYSVRFSAVAAGFINYQLDWYEHTPKD